MSSTLVAHLQDQRHHAYTPYLTESCGTFPPAFQTRPRSPTSQNNWHTAATLAGTNVCNPYAISPPVGASEHRSGSTPTEDVSNTACRDPAYSSVTERQEEPLQHAGQHPNAFYQAEDNIPFSHPRPQPHPSQSFIFSSFGETTCAHTTPPQLSFPLMVHTSTQSNAFLEGADGSQQYKTGYQARSAPMPSYREQHTPAPPHIMHDERRGSISSTVSTDNALAYYPQDDHTSTYEQYPSYGTAHQPIVHPAATPPSSHVRPRTLPAASHTPPCSAPDGHEHFHPSPSNTTLSSAGAGEQLSVEHQTRLVMNAQSRQSEQRERPNQLPKRVIGMAVSSRRRKANPSDESSLDDTKSTTTLKSKRREQAASRYKAAYERVRHQRDFFERATSSLMHQVRMLGGDPLQASDRGMKGEDMDPKKARLLIASLQQDLENSRERLLETQTDLHKLRQILDNSPRPYYPFKEDDAPLSAAPKTMHNHRR